jgi:hypothetical protein
MSEEAPVGPDVVRELSGDQARALQSLLLRVFARFGLQVRVGLDGSGEEWSVVIESEDPRVRADGSMPVRSAENVEVRENVVTNVEGQGKRVVLGQAVDEE